jgi:hypothetical protein
VLRPCLDIVVDVGAPIEVGAVPGGVRRVIPIVGGTVKAPDWEGRVLGAGADFQLLADAGTDLLDARYVIESSAGERLFVENHAVRCGPAALMAQLRRGEPVDAQQIYFRCAPRFETAAPRLQWMSQRVFVGVGARHARQVDMRFYVVE